MIKNLLHWMGLLMAVILLPAVASAQYKNTTGESTPPIQNQAKQKQSDVHRRFIGGMFGGGFSTYNSFVQVSPIFGYKITPKFHLGTRLTYIYESFKDPSVGVRYNLHSYGGGLFSRYLFYRFLFAQVEYELLSIPVYPYKGNRRAVNSFFVGGGIIQNVGKSGFSTITVLYNLHDTVYSPYSNPLIRVGFGISF